MSHTGVGLFWWRDWPGQTMAEFAAVATVLFVLLFAIIEMGIVIYRYNMVCSAAREAVRYAIVHKSDTTGIKNAAINSAPFLTTSNITPSLVTDPSDSSKQDARVAISYTYVLRMPLFSPITFTLTSTSQMLVSE
jgi:Flp pilus assembly protein TadG